MQLDITKGEQDFLVFELVDENGNPFSNPTVKLNFGTYDSAGEDFYDAQIDSINGAILKGRLHIDSTRNLPSGDYTVRVLVSDGAVTRIIKVQEPLILL